MSKNCWEYAGWVEADGVQTNYFMRVKHAVGTYCKGLDASKGPFACRVEHHVSTIREELGISGAFTLEHCTWGESNFKRAPAVITAWSIPAVCEIEGIGLRQLMQWLLDGEKIRVKAWPKGHYIMLNTENKLVGHLDQEISPDILSGDVWEIYTPTAIEVDYYDAHRLHRLYKNKPNVKWEVCIPKNAPSWIPWNGYAVTREFKYRYTE